MIAMAVLVLLYSLLFQAGCVKKSAINEKPSLSEDKVSAQAQAATDVLSKEGKSVPKKGGAEKEETLAEGPVTKVPDNAVAEKDKATQLMLAKEASAGEASQKAGALRGSEAAADVKTEAVLKDIHFDFDKFSLKPENREILKGHADWLLGHRDYLVTIEGHCDEMGTTEYNLALGERRAGEAKRFLVDLGVAEARISTISYGKERPLDTGHDEEAWAKNRRAHFIVTLKK
jgi:peptidoglycan-associated lipoprotein